MKTKLFNLDLGGLLVRYYMMMGVIILAVFTGYPIFALLGLPIFLSAILGVNFSDKKVKDNAVAKDLTLIKYKQAG